MILYNYAWTQPNPNFQHSHLLKFYQQLRILIFYQCDSFPKKAHKFWPNYSFKLIPLIEKYIYFPSLFGFLGMEFCENPRKWNWKWNEKIKRRQPAWRRKNPLTSNLTLLHRFGNFPCSCLPSYGLFSIIVLSLWLLLSYLT